jgi:ectoine hydroxylase-related dioxygenase (phytanoyl-CoA dioxygenase family)
MEGYLMDLKTHGVKNFSQAKNQFEFNQENFTRDGFTLIKKVLSESEILKANELVMSIYEKQEKEFGRDVLKSLNELNIVRALCGFDEFFLHKVAVNTVLRPYIDAVLGENYVLHSQVATINEPQVQLYQTAWHRELQYQHFTSSRPLAVQTIYCLDPFNAETGATFLLPGSHLFEEFPSENYCKNHEFQLMAEPGDVLFMNSMVYHRAGINTSKNLRRLITNTYSSPIIGQQINLSKMMDPRFRDDNFLSGLLGFRWSPSNSPSDWRKSKINS